MLRMDYYTLPASSGTGNILDSELAEEIFVPESKAAEKADFVISVGGDSMEPTYHNGDKVFVEKCNSFDVGEIGIFVVNGEVFVKERGNGCLISHIEQYKPYSSLCMTVYSAEEELWEGIIMKKRRSFRTIGKTAFVALWAIKK